MPSFSTYIELKVVDLVFPRAQPAAKNVHCTCGPLRWHVYDLMGHPGAFLGYIGQLSQPVHASVQMGHCRGS